MESSTLLEAKGIWQEFKLPTGKLYCAVEGVSLEVKSKEVVALLGPSGCGKSTILRTLAGLLRPAKGQVFYHGREMTGLTPGVAMVFQSFALFPWMTVTQNVETVLSPLGLPPKDLRARSLDAIRRVGLAGFENSYPRELSGGMKQRVGIARALSTDPEILFMDEPFSQVDALTAESLRAEVIDIWAVPDHNPSSVVMVSHDIKEVVYMADRIVVLSANPGRILTITQNRLPRPRDYRSADFLALVDQLHEIITGSEMPDVPEVPSVSFYEPIPEVGAGQVVGLLEYLDARGGKDDLFRIASDTGQEFGTVILVVKGAEMLDFVETPRRMVQLSPTGKRFVKGGIEERKAVWREQLLQLRLFKEVHQLISRQPEKEAELDLIMEKIVIALPTENFDKTFETLVRWARYANLFLYHEDSQKFTLASTENAVQASNPDQ